MPAPRSIVIIDDKLGSGASSLAEKLNARTTDMRVEFRVHPRCDGTAKAAAAKDVASAAVVFLHYHNRDWRHFATTDCRGKDVVLTSTSPKEAEVADDLRAFDPDDVPRLFMTSISSTTDWQSLRWVDAIRDWNADLFPLDPLGMRSQETLCALVILCEGYLAVHAISAADGQTQERVAADLFAPAWHQFWNAQSDEGTASRTATLRTRWTAVRSPSWWTQVFPDIGSLHAAIAREWQQDTPGLDAVSALADAVAIDQPVAAVVVFDAYQALQTQLK
jgi:hypothetical protein